MTVPEFALPALTEEQWAKLNELAVSLKPGQALWISGYFAGLGRAYPLDQSASSAIQYGAIGTLSDASANARSLTILFGSETGNSAALARSLGEQATKQGLEPVLADMADYKPRRLKDEQDLIILTSTHGEGDPPRSALGFFEFIEGRKAPRLPDLRYAVLALGDSTYERYCEAGKRLDRRLAELGATEIQSRIDCDVDYDEPAADWIRTLLPRLTPKASSPATAAASSTLPASDRSDSFDKRHPFPAAVIENIVLTGRGSSKETRHVELSLAGSGIIFEPGDALGIMPQNDPRLLEDIVEALSLAPETPVVVKDQAMTLGAALGSAYEITAITPRFIEHWAGVSGSTELTNMLRDDQHEVRAGFMRKHHVLDVLRRFPAAGGVEPQALVKALRPLQPRLYSIASSHAAAPDEAHITVTTVRYELNGIARSGVASGYLADHAAADVTLPVYIQSNPHFRLTEDEHPIIMIGAGTGVAPYRAFVQEREARGAAGKSWLFFGERNFHTDFLYQTEWQDFLRQGSLTRMDVAFSRDLADKVYVQHRLRERARDVYAWIEEGAHIYVCGDAEHLAPDVHAALIAIIQDQGAIGRDAAIEYLSALQSDHRYQIDVY